MAKITNITFTIMKEGTTTQSANALVYYESGRSVVYFPPYPRTVKHFVLQDNVIVRLTYERDLYRLVEAVERETPETF